MNRRINHIGDNIKEIRKNVICGIASGIAIGICIYLLIRNIIFSIIGGIIVAILLIHILNNLFYRKWFDKWSEFYDKEYYIDPSTITNKSEELKQIIDLDKELCDFLEKYSSGKNNDFYETELNKQWQKKEEYFTTKADKVLSKMKRTDLLLVTHVTKQLFMIIDFLKYLKPINPDIEYMKNNPNNLLPYYKRVLEEEQALQDLSINDNYFEIFKEGNKFAVLEYFILSCMSPEEIIELANSSHDWNEKMYYYGFLKKEK